MMKKVRIEDFVFGIGVLGLLEDVTKAVGAEAFSCLQVIEGRKTIFAAYDEAGIKAIDEMAVALSAYNRQVPAAYHLAFSTSLAVPTKEHTSEAELLDGNIRSSFTSCRGIPVTTRFDRELNKTVFTTPTFWRIDLNIEVATGKMAFTVTKYGCKRNADGLPEWQLIRRSEEKGGRAVKFTFDGEDAIEKVTKNTYVSPKFFADQIEAAKAEMPRDAWQQTLAQHVQQQMRRPGVVVAESD